MALQQSDVPGFTQIDPSEATLTDPNDQGPDQAFIQCAANTPLLNQFDTGPDALVGPFYGEDPSTLYGQPTYNFSVASVVFGDGSDSDASIAYSTLTSTAFQHCWASTADSLNTAQAIIPNVRPTVVTTMTTPEYGAASAGYLWNVEFSYEGSDSNWYYGFSMILQGSIVLLLVSLSINTTFPASLRNPILAKIAARWEPNQTLHRQRALLTPRLLNLNVSAASTGALRMR